MKYESWAQFMRDWSGIQEAITRKFRVARQTLYGQTSAQNGDTERRANVNQSNSGTSGRGRGRRVEINPRDFILDEAVEDNRYNNNNDYEYEELSPMTPHASDEELPDLEQPYTQAENVYEID